MDNPDQGCLAPRKQTLPAEIVLREKSNFLNGIKPILPSSPTSENISLYNSEIPNYIYPVQSHRGALRERHERGVGCDGRGSARDERA
jgi:hypothetical protein